MKARVVGPGDGPPLHTHEAQDESWYVLEGELRFKLGDTMQAAPAGSFVFVPRGTVHAFQNVGPGPARILVIFTPAGMEPFFERFAELPGMSRSTLACSPDSAPRWGWKWSGRRCRCRIPSSAAKGPVKRGRLRGG